MKYNIKITVRNHQSEFHKKKKKKKKKIADFTLWGHIYLTVGLVKRSVFQSRRL